MFVEYAKANVEDILVRIVVARTAAAVAAPMHLLPTIWFRNTWSWFEGVTTTGPARRSRRARRPHPATFRRIRTTAPAISISRAIARAALHRERDQLAAPLRLPQRLTLRERRHQRRGGHRRREDAVNPEPVAPNRRHGTGAPFPRGARVEMQLRLTDRDLAARRRVRRRSTRSSRNASARPTSSTTTSSPVELSDDAKNVMRQAFAGLLWSKQFYHYVVADGCRAIPSSPPPPSERRAGRNKEWGHLYNADVLSMPDKWEYPWYAAWDLAFHCLPLALVDADFAKEQLS